jgi:signal transduction histidine kinase
MHDGPPQKEPETMDFAPRLRLSLRVRLCVLMVALFSLIICTMLGVLCLYEKAAITDRMHLELANWANGFAVELSDRIHTITDADLSALRRERLDVFPFQSLTIDVFHESGMHTAGSEGGTLRWADLGLAEVPTASSPVLVTLSPEHRTPIIPDAQSYIVAVVGATGPTGERFAIALSTTDAFIQRRLAILYHLALASGALSIVAAAATGWFIAGVAVAPFERLRDLARRLEPGDPSPPPQTGHVSAEVASLTQELEHARKRIGERFAAQERFLSNVSHEIKTPIAIMLADAQTLNLQSATPDVRKFVSASQDELLRLGRLVESFLTLARVEDGKDTPQSRTTAANDLVMDSIENCSKMARQYRVTLVPHLLADEECVDAAVSGDPDLLRTMLDNLLRNAIRFSPEHGRVEVSISCDAACIRIVTIDQGPGIPPDKLETIFNRFSQAHGGPRYQRGHGLGLAIAQGIAELHGGIITASNRIDAGCEFLVQLPRVQSTAGAGARPRPPDDDHPRRNGAVGQP